MASGAGPRRVGVRPHRPSGGSLRLRKWRGEAHGGRGHDPATRCAGRGGHERGNGLGRDVSEPTRRCAATGGGRPWAPRGRTPEPRWASRVDYGTRQGDAATRTSTTGRRRGAAGEPVRTGTVGGRRPRGRRDGPGEGEPGKNFSASGPVRRAPDGRDGSASGRAQRVAQVRRGAGGPTHTGTIVAVSDERRMALRGRGGAGQLRRAARPTRSYPQTSTVMPHRMARRVPHRVANH